MFATWLICSTEKVKLFAVPETYKDTDYKYTGAGLQKGKPQSKLVPEVYDKSRVS